MLWIQFIRLTVPINESIQLRSFWSPFRFTQHLIGYFSSLQHPLGLWSSCSPTGNASGYLSETLLHNSFNAVSISVLCPPPQTCEQCLLVTRESIYFSECIVLLSIRAYKGCFDNWCDIESLQFIRNEFTDESIHYFQRNTIEWCIHVQKLSKINSIFDAMNERVYIEIISW